ncbi:zinc finger protein klumpfuss [Rhipicephalus microplus]|uniref:zinc finger protein klumpfuss n=1 Tax=Rhipicephalus microplus TaxID=6941 RepID=UPI003F6B81FC
MWAVAGEALGAHWLRGARGRPASQPAPQTRAWWRRVHAATTTRCAALAPYAEIASSSADGRRAAWPAWAADDMTSKRRRLSAVLDKLAERRDVFSPPATSSSDSSSCCAEDGPLDLSLPAHVCSSCGQGFAQRERLAKHVASRHGRPDGRAYGCDVCGRCFARSDMLTRHMRLHTGLKPYTCRVCGQVFSRSDHLSTHQRTHTGEKPYKCPLCPYAACRRDMITRHMRTHARYDSSGPEDEGRLPKEPGR